MSSTMRTNSRPRTGAGPFAVAVIVAAAVASGANAVIAVLAKAAGASEVFVPLQPQAYIFLTVVGVIAGAIGWAAVRRWSRRPATALRWLVPAVLVVSVVPDVILPFTDSQPGTSWLGVIALILMHLAAAVVAVPAFARTLPVRDR